MTNDHCQRCKAAAILYEIRNRITGKSFWVCYACREWVKDGIARARREGNPAPPEEVPDE
jgi:hypothetical protein